MTPPFHIARASLLTARALFLLSVARGLRHSLSVRQKQKLLTALSGTPLHTKNHRRIAAAHRRAARLYGASVLCLDRALALSSDLQSAGLSPRLRFGVKHTPLFEAHAWVELEGKALNEDASHLAEFAPFDDVLGERWFRQARR